MRIGTENWNKQELETVDAELELHNNKEHGPHILYVSLYSFT